MSLAPKIDEVTQVLIQEDRDSPLTWYMVENILSNPIDIVGYQILWRDRSNRLHGGAYFYVKNCIESKISTELHIEDYELSAVDFVATKTSTLRILAYYSRVIYHPTDNNVAKEDLTMSSEFIEQNYPNRAIILSGDFNKLCFKFSAKLFHLIAMINFSTRGKNILDQIKEMSIWSFRSSHNFSFPSNTAKGNLWKKQKNNKTAW